MSTRAQDGSAGERKPTLLFIDHDVPQHDLYAGSRTNLMYLELLVSMGLEVRFLASRFQRVEPYSSNLNQLGIETLDGDWFRENWETWLRQHGSDIDYVLINKPDPAEIFLSAIRKWTRAAIIYQCHDLHHLRLRRKGEVENDAGILAEADRYKRLENTICDESDVVLTFSTVEEELIAQAFPGKPVYTVPLFFYPDVPDTGRDFDRRRDLLFVGACSHTPNQDAIDWFCRKVFPLVLEQQPQVVFNVVSAHAPDEITALASDNVNILGRVSEEELNELYRTSKLVVVPLRFGAGVKGKVIEALYQGVPVVSTAIGLEGIADTGHLASASDTAEAFAAEILALYGDSDTLAERSRRGARLVEERFTQQAAADRMAGILNAALVASGERLARSPSPPAEYVPPRLLAFYLPQYHPIPENDEWWGEGFTDWKNVAASQPLFAGHHQPHVPKDLGYYDLRDPEARAAQAELAREHGIEGFCYYHYWFNGHRLLEAPLQAVLESGEPDFPFCVCWANENWTRRWDGFDQDVLMQQNYGEEDDRAHIHALLPLLRDPRYIRINGKPLLLIYRTEIMPDPARTAEIWREEARQTGVGEIYLCRVESFSKGDPVDIGFDAAVEFAPDWANLGPRLKADTGLKRRLGDDLEQVCEDHLVFDYEALGKTMMAKEPPGYRWMRCVTPSWDNSARRKKDACMFLDSNPDKYRAWLDRAIDDTQARLKGEERVLFINAWNEWAEGNHLEPDEKFGHGYLKATLAALEASRTAAARPSSGIVGASELAAELARHKAKQEELQTRLEQKERQIEEMMQSTSWRLTAPVRWLKQLWLDRK